MGFKGTIPLLPGACNRITLPDGNSFKRDQISDVETDQDECADAEIPVGKYAEIKEKNRYLGQWQRRKIK